MTQSFTSKCRRPFDLTIEWASDLHFESTVASFSFASTDKEQYDSKITPMGRDFDSTVKFIASTGKEYCECSASTDELSIIQIYWNRQNVVTMETSNAVNNEKSEWSPDVRRFW